MQKLGNTNSLVLRKKSSSALCKMCFFSQCHRTTIKYVRILLCAVVTFNGNMDFECFKSSESQHTLGQNRSRSRAIKLLQPNLKGLKVFEIKKSSKHIADKKS